MKNTGGYDNGEKRFEQYFITRNRTLQSSYAFVSMFTKYNITSVNQVLDDKLMNDIMMCCHNCTRNQLMGFIALIKYKYLNIPIVSSKMLDSKCVGDLTELYGLGCNLFDIDRIRVYLKKYRVNTNIDIENLNNYRLIEIITAVLPFCDQRLSTILEIIIENYKQNENLDILNKDYDDDLKSSKDIELIKKLKDQLAPLTTMRDNLDTQIFNLTHRIELLINQSKSGVKK